MPDKQHHRVVIPTHLRIAQNGLLQKNKTKKDRKRISAESYDRHVPPTTESVKGLNRTEHEWQVRPSTASFATAQPLADPLQLLPLSAAAQKCHSFRRVSTGNGMSEHQRDIVVRFPDKPISVPVGCSAEASHTATVIPTSPRLPTSFCHAVTTKDAI